jgi:hypothetical protein
MLNWTLRTLLGVALVWAPRPNSGLRPPLRATPPHQADSTAAWARYFAGRWGCAGGFPSGKLLRADVVFTPRLGGRWLEYHHTDRAPGRYEALALWGPAVGASQTVQNVLYDNFGGQRRFASDGWRNGALVFVRDSAEAGAREERFIFRERSESTFWFAWEVRRPNVPAWAVGDSLTCAREPAPRG